MPMSMLAGDCAELRAELLRQGLEIANNKHNAAVCPTYPIRKTGTEGALCQSYRLA